MQSKIEKLRRNRSFCAEHENYQPYCSECIADLLDVIVDRIELLQKVIAQLERDKQETEG